MDKTYNIWRCQSIYLNVFFKIVQATVTKGEKKQQFLKTLYSENTISKIVKESRQGKKLSSQLCIAAIATTLRTTETTALKTGINRQK